MPRLSPTARRDEIVAATLRVASTKGLANTTVRDVAAEMGTSSGLIHHYFSSMDEVLAAAFEQAASDDLQTTETAMESCNGSLERLSSFFASYTRTDEYSAFQMWLDAWAEASRRPALGATSRLLNIAWQRLVATTIAEGIDEGTMSCDDPDATAWRVLSLLDGLSLQLSAHPGLIERRLALDWTMTALETEVGLAPGALTRPPNR
ncbi:MAG: TetR family transcriptional regulator C-terminal domain-containing protein [Ilumatobacteraceae bacterium]